MKRYWYRIIWIGSIMSAMVITICFACWNDSLKVQGANIFENAGYTKDIEHVTVLLKEMEDKTNKELEDKKTIDKNNIYTQAVQEQGKDENVKEAVLEIGIDENVLRQTVQQAILPESSTVIEESEENKILVNGDVSGVLFIGDSRTVGLSAYGNLGEAEFFASSGMNVYKLFDSKLSTKDGTKKLEELFSEKSFQTIYLMLGINELGYDYSRTVKQYKATVDKIKEMQPDAVLVLQANLHVTEESSNQSSIFNNEKINAFNEDIKKIAEENSYYYIDVNEIFDDENGNLDIAYCSDGIHLMGKYYSMWGEWIRGK